MAPTATTTTSNTPAPTKRVRAKSTIIAPPPTPEPVPEPIVEPTPEPETSGSETEPTAGVEVQLENLRSLVNTLSKEIAEKLKVFKTIEQEIKKLSITIKKDSKKKHKKVKSNVSKNHGFGAPALISEDLAGFLGLPLGSKLKRPEVTSLISKYANEHGLKNPDNKTIFLPDAKLKKVFGPAIWPLKKSDENGYDIFNLQKYMKPHFIKPEPTA